MIVEAEHSEINFLSQVYAELKDLEYRYPHFRSWFYDQVVPGLESGNRRIITIQESSEIQAILILKNSSEKKICTLRVAEKCRNSGLGTLLIDFARQELGTDYPLITVSRGHIGEFAPLFKKFDFRFKNRYLNYYTRNSVEYCFNGDLLVKNYCAR